MTTYYICKDGDMLDQICWKHYGQQSGAVEQVLLANPGLADLGYCYEAGTKILMPVITIPTTQPLRLWD